MPTLTRAIVGMKEEADLDDVDAMETEMKGMAVEFHQL